MHGICHMSICECEINLNNFVRKEISANYNSNSDKNYILAVSSELMCSK